MALDFGVSELIASEYERFLEGIANLSDGGQRAARAAAARVRADEPAVKTITAPAWDDVVHITPRPIITREMRQTYYAAKRAGQPSPLAPQLNEEIERRGRRARSISTSAAPEYAKSYGQVMTALDNVQDLLTTVTTTGRFLLQGGARLLDTMGPSASVAEIEAARLAGEQAAARQLALRAARGELITGLVRAEALALSREAAGAAAARGIGARTIGRLVPILGPVLIAADILKLITWLGLMFFPAYAAVCAGLPAALSAGVLPTAQALLGKRAGKTRVGVLGKLNPFSMTARLDRANTLRSWRPSIYNLMEVAQTTDQLFGVGVSFGGLVGLVSEAAFSTEAARRGIPVRVDASELVNSVHAALRPELVGVSTTELADLRAAAGVLAHGPIFQRVQETFTFEEHVDALVAQCAAWSILRPWYERPSFEQAIALGLDGRWRPPRPAWDDTREIITLELGQAPPYDTWPLPGNPDRIRGQEYMETTAREIPGALAELLLPRQELPEAGFAGAVVSQITDRAVIALTGSERGVELKWQPSWALAEALAFAGRVPIAGDDEGKLLHFWQLAIARQQEHDAVLLEAAHFDELAEQAGIHLLRVE